MFSTASLWATHWGAELDLLVVRGSRRLGFEFKRPSSSSLADRIRVVGLTRLAEALEPLQ